METVLVPLFQTGANPQGDQLNLAMLALCNKVNVLVLGSGHEITMLGLTKLMAGLGGFGGAAANVMLLNVIS